MRTVVYKCDWCGKEELSDIIEGEDYRPRSWVSTTVHRLSTEEEEICDDCEATLRASISNAGAHVRAERLALRGVAAEPVKELGVRMRIWLLKPTERARLAEWSFNCCYGVVVRALSEDNAREVAARNHANEGSAVWLSDKVRCVALSDDAEGPEELLLRDVIRPR